MSQKNSSSLQLQNSKVRKFRDAPNKDKAQLDWEILQNAIIEIQKKNNSHLSFEHLYRTAYCMILSSFGQKLYEGTKETVQSHLIKHVRPQILASSDNKYKLTFQVLRSWEEHRTSMSMIKDILMYMDRCYCETQKLDKVNVVGIYLFRDQIIRYSQIEKPLREHVLDKILKSRQNLSQQNQLQLKEVTNMLMHLGNGDRLVYETIIEKEFLVQTAGFYGEEAEAKLNSIPCIGFVGEIFYFKDPP